MLNILNILSTQIHSAYTAKRIEELQVAQLWQRDRAKLDTFSINSQRYSHNHA